MSLLLLSGSIWIELVVIVVLLKQGKPIWVYIYVRELEKVSWVHKDKFVELNDK